MRRFLLLFSVIFSISSFFFLFQPPSVYALACTGDNGGAGDCSAAMACPSPNIDGFGTCMNPEICCLTSLPPGNGGNGDCSDTCTTSAQCLDQPINLACTYGVCTDSATCSSCKGTSGQYGSCLSEGVCTGMGKNQKDGTGTCMGGYVCCTNAASSDSCTLHAPYQAPSGADFSVTLNSTEKNTTYIITTSPATCTGPCLSNPVTDANGFKSCTLNCGPPHGTYTITARHGIVACSTNIQTANIPGIFCYGNSGATGWCHAGVLCPNNTFPDGLGSCVGGPDLNCCVGYVDQAPVFCDTINQKGIRTAIGCIYAENPRELINQITRWSLGLAAGLALIIIVFSGFTIVISGGDSKKIAGARNQIMSALMGLAFIAISILVLNFLGVKILNLNTFGFNIHL